MSFNPTGPAAGPTSGPVPGPVPGSMPGPAPGQARGGTGPAPRGAAPVVLIGAVATLLMEALLLLFTLVAATDPLGVLLTMVGLGTHFIDAPTQFTAGDVAICAVLAAGVVGSLGGRVWGRTAITTTMALIGYPLATSLLSELTTAEERHGFTQGHNLWFNLVMIVELLIAAGTLVAAFVTSRGGRTAGAGPVAPLAGAPMFGAMPGQAPLPGLPYPQQSGPGQTYPQQQGQAFPGYPAQQGRPGYPPQPLPQQQGQPFPSQAQQPSAQGYVPPQAPPQGGPVQQPMPAQDSTPYRPTQYSPPPGSPSAGPHGNPPIPPGA